MTLRSPYNLRLAVEKFKLNQEDEGKPEDQKVASEEETKGAALYSSEASGTALETRQRTDNMAPTKLTFLQGSEVLKFKGNRTSKDGVFSPGPRIQDFFESIEAYFH